MAKYITPAVTPLTEDGKLDREGLEALYEHLIRGGVDGILTLGSIGEFFALGDELKRELITEAVRIVGGRVPLLVGTGDTVFERTVALSHFALDAGADAVVIVPPYYFSLQGESVEEYYDAVCGAVDGKIYLYNFPDRTGYEIPVETVRRLALRHPNIAGIKDTISGMDHTRKLIKAVKPVRPEFEIYSGFDDNFAHNVLSGGDGCIAGLSNLAPELCHAWAQAVNCGDFARSAECQRKIDRLMDIYRVGSPFVPFIKCALALRGVGIKDAATVPLPKADEAQREELIKIMRQEGLL